MTENDLDQMAAALRRAMCLHVEAVKSTATLEQNPKKPDVTHLSPDPVARDNSFKHLHGRGISAFKRAGVQWKDVNLRGRWVEPYRRKVASELRYGELRRVNDVVSRVREGLMMALLDEGFDTWFDTTEGLDVARRLFRALIDWDYPAVAMMADERPELAERLSTLLAFTEDEYIAMACLDDDEWRHLGEREQPFPRYYQQRSA